MKISKRFNMKLSGWGSCDSHLTWDEHQGVKDYLKKNFSEQIFIDPKMSAVPSMQYELQSTMPEELIDAFCSLLGEKYVFSDHAHRLAHCGGKSYLDLLRMQQGKVSSLPDLVVYPKDASEITQLIKVCEKESVAVIPFGGGTSVASGLSPVRGKHKYCLALNMNRLRNVIEVNLEDLTARVEAGIFGPELEEQLKLWGVRLGHYPQSFEFSTLGGWVATRSSGQNSFMFGGIEKMVHSIKAITPRGELQTLDVPRMSAGPDIKEILLGSEGRYGIIVEVTVKVSPLPQLQDYQMHLFKNFDAAKRAAKALAQSQLKLAMIRVSDAGETQAMFAMSGKKKGFAALVSQLIKKKIKLQGYESEKMCSMLIGVEGDAAFVRGERKNASEVAQKYGAISLGGRAGSKWLRERFKLPYLRDLFMASSLMVDTFETSAKWDDLDYVYVEISREIKKKFPKALLYCHLSHLYHEGSSLYFTIIAQQSEQPEKQWQSFKELVNAKIKSLKIAPSHHHAIGIDHLSAMQQDLGQDVMKAVAKKLDPKEIINPGKLF